jgi:hypothetical protein
MKDPIFIVGNSRSGSTLISRILKKHPEIYILNETHFVEEFRLYRNKISLCSQNNIWKLVNRMLTIQRKGYYRKSMYEEYPRDAQKIISVFNDCGHYDFITLNKIFFELEANQYGKKWAGDQTPRHVFYIQELIDWYPEAKFIHIVRNPCAVLFSQKKKWKAGLRWGLPRFELLRTFLNYHPITTTIIWEKSVTAGLKSQKTITKKSMKTVFFENLVANPKKEIKKICDFLQIEFILDMINVTVEFSAKKNDEGYKGISKAISERWISELSKTEIFIAERLAGCRMKYLGYHLMGAKPNLLKLLFYIFVWPFQLILSFTFNLNRMGNPANYLSKRLFKKGETKLVKL